MRRRFAFRAFAALALFCGMALLVSTPEIIAAGKEAEAKKALEDLKKAKDAKAKVASLTKLGELGQIQYAYVEDAIPEIFKAIKDKEADVRSAAAIALGKIGPDDKETVPQLTGLLKDKEESVKFAAVEGLAYLGKKAESAVGALREAAKDLGEKDKLKKSINKTIQAIQAKPKKN